MRLDGIAAACGGVLMEAPPLERVREALLEDSSRQSPECCSASQLVPLRPLDSVVLRKCPRCGAQPS